MHIPVLKVIVDNHFYHMYVNNILSLFHLFIGSLAVSTLHVLVAYRNISQFVFQCQNSDYDRFKKKNEFCRAFLPNSRYLIVTPIITQDALKALTKCRKYEGKM